MECVLSFTGIQNDSKRTSSLTVNVIFLKETKPLSLRCMQWLYFSGCPFKHTSADLLRQKLKSYKTSSEAIDEIIDLVKGNHFQIACQKYFEASHKASSTSNVVAGVTKLPWCNDNYS